MRKTAFVLLFLALALPGYAQLNCSGGLLNCGGAALASSLIVTPGISVLNGGITTPGIVGSTTNDSAAAGNIGEIITATLASGSAVTLGTGSASTVTSIQLTGGDWDVTGVVDYIPNAATSITLLTQGLLAQNGCTGSPALGAQDTFTQWETAANVIGASNPAWAIPVVRVSIASTTTVCLISKPAFSVNSLTAYGTIRARRTR